MTGDLIYESFLRAQAKEAMELASQSDIVEVTPLSGSPPNSYGLAFHCKGLVRVGGEVKEGNLFHVGIRFPDDYVRRANPYEVLTWLHPLTVWHPNIHPRGGICIGPLAPGTPLVDLIYRVYEVIGYVKLTPREDDALNRAACQWARSNMHLFPIDSRPLKRRDLPVNVDPIAEEDDA
jgi:ubiquitin-protein ligase